MPDLPLDCDDGVRDDQVVVRAETRGPIGAACKSDPAAVDDKWQAENTREQSPSRPRAHDPPCTGDPRDTYRAEAEPQPLQLHRRAAGRPKPLDIAMAEEFLLLEGADGERFATDAVVFSPDGAADGARHIRAAGVGAGGAADGAGGTAEAGAAGSALAAAAGTAERPIALPAAAGAAAPGNRRPLSQCDLTAADGPSAPAPEPTDSADGGSASDLDSCGDPMAAPRQEARAWGRPAPAAPLPRLHGHGHGLDYPDWLDVSMEPPDTGEASSVGGFFSRVAASAAPPETAGLPGLVSGAEGGAVRRYGTPQSAVEVRINRQDQKNPPAVSGRVKGVQFSPMVSEVRWRETYLDEDSADGRSMSPAWDARDEEYCRGEPGAPPRPPLPAQHAALRPAGHTSSSAGQGSAPPPPPRTDSRSVSARSAETQRLRVSFPVDGGDGHTVRRQVVTCERAADVTQTHSPPPPRADAAEMPTRRSASLTATSPAVPRGAAQQPEKSRTMMERLGLGRLSGSRRRAAGGQERSSLTSRRSPSPGVSSVVVRETEITSPRPEVVTPVAATSLDTAHPGVVSQAPRAAPRTVSPVEAAAVAAAAAVGRSWDASNRTSPRVETSPSPQPSPQRLTERLDYLDQPICVTSPPERETVISSAPAAATPKPPLPPRVTASQVTRARLISARNQFLSSPSAAPRAVPPPPVSDASPPPGDGAAGEVRDAFERFRRQAREERERLAQSTPDLSLIETTTKRLVRPPSPDPRPRHAEPAWRDDGYEIDWGESTSTVRLARPAPSPVARAWPKMPPRRPPGERLPSQETDLDSIVRGLQQFIDEISPGRGKAKSLLNLEQTEELTCRTAAAAADSRAKSMEFLLDEENKATTLPPENQLMRGGAARELSRPELRFQRSLRNLNTPEWYRRAAVAPVAALRRNHHDTASLQGGWSGLSSKSNSKESLPTCAAPTPLPRRGHWRSFRASRETSSVPGTAAASPAPLSRRASSGSSRRPGCPAAAAPAAVSGSPGARRPYLGWRSQERLTRSGYQTPEERLASSFRGTPGVRRQVASQERPQVSSEGQVTPPAAAQHVSASIREVTDAIVHYFDPDVQTQNGRRESPGLTRAAREESPSKQRSLWLETAFVGTRPADGAGEPTKGGSTIGGALLPAADVRKEPFELDGHCDGGIRTKTDGTRAAATCTKRLESVTMDEVLDSLLAMRRASPPGELCRPGESLGRVAVRARSTSRGHAAGI